MSPRLVFRPQRHFGPFNAEKFARWAPTLAVWGAGAGAAVTLLLSSTPVFYKNLLAPLPYFDEYYTDKTPDSDKPF